MSILSLKTLFTDLLMVSIKIDYQFFTTNNMGNHFCSDKMKHILTRDHLVNDRWFYTKDITRGVEL